MLRGNKKLLSGFLAVTIFGTIISPTAFAETSQLKSEQSQIQEERSRIKTELTEAEKEVAKVLAEIESLNEQIERNNEALEENKKMIEQTEKDIEATEEELAELEEEIDELEKDIEFRKELLKERAVTYQKNGVSVNYLQVVLGAKSFSEFIERIYNVSQIAQADENFLETLNNNIEKVEEKKADVENKLEELNDLRTELDGMNQLIEEQIEANNELKKELEKKEKENREILNQLKDKDSELAQREAAIREAIRRAEENNRPQLASRSATPSTYVANGSAQDVINAGMRYVGNSAYGYGSQNPSRGIFDCSGFTQWAYKQIGVNIGRSTGAQASVGERISFSEARPGDLVFFDTYKKNGHVGIYLGNGKFLGSQSSTGVAVADMNSSYWKNAFKGHVRRVLK